MKANYYVLFIIAVATWACNKEDEISQNYRDTTFSWMVGAEHSTDTTLLLPTSSVTNNYLTVASYSICPNSDLKITVRFEDQVLLDTVYQNGDSKYLIPASKDKPLSVHSRLIDNGSLILCVWLGQAEIKYDYVE